MDKAFFLFQLNSLQVTLDGYKQKLAICQNTSVEDSEKCKQELKSKLADKDRVIEEVKSDFSELKNLHELLKV